MRRLRRRATWTWLATLALSLIAVCFAQADEDLAYFGHLRWDDPTGHEPWRWLCIFGAYFAIWTCYWLGVHRGRAER